jgi:hypothetical protein
MASEEGDLVSPDGAEGTADHDVLGPATDRLVHLTRNLLDATSVANVLEQVVWTAHRNIPGADVVSVTLRSPDGSLHTSAETDPVASKLDRLQYETGEGPCLDIDQGPGRPLVSSEDLAAEPTWSRFGPAAAAHGVRAVLSVPLLLDQSPHGHSGALTLYARRARVLTLAAREPALLLATHASLALARTVTVTSAELAAASLRNAMDTRDVIGQAKGVLMALHGISADEAFDRLRRVSQDLNIKLVEVARILATRHTEVVPHQRPVDEGRPS